MEQGSSKDCDQQVITDPTPLDKLKYFQVHHEKDGVIFVLAKDGDDAIEAFYNSIESCIGHTLGICGCNGPSKPMDRSKIIRPLKVVDCSTGQVVKILLYPELKNQGWPEDKRGTNEKETN